MGRSRLNRPARVVEPATASTLRRLWRVAVATVSALVILSILGVTLYRDVPPPATPLMLIRLAEGYGIDKSWRPLSDISDKLVRAVMAGEDAKFCTHHGFDWEAIENAWARYRTGRHRLLGASTISMQTAKNVFLWPGRDWLRKAVEAYFTALIELAWSKDRIIEVYLNVVEWGPGIYGAEAAAQHYYHRSAKSLTRAQAARLAAILPDPLDRSPTRPGRAVLAHAAFIRDQMPDVPSARPFPCGEVL
jgi:monofunctional biosynthetic peptidoglycan transglycosylase